MQFSASFGEQIAFGKVHSSPMRCVCRVMPNASCPHAAEKMIHENDKRRKVEKLLSRITNGVTSELKEYHC